MLTFRRSTLAVTLAVTSCTAPHHDASRTRRYESSTGAVHHARLARLASDVASPRALRPLRAAEDTDGLHVVVSLEGRELWVLDGDDTIRTASVAVGMDSTLSYDGKVWNFETPRGTRRVIAKQANPTWAPPEWHYVEIAQSRHLRLVRLPEHEPYLLPDSSEILVRDSVVGLVQRGESFRPFAEGEEIVWDSTLYIPPLGSRQRHVEGELGHFRLDLGNGYLMHGTPHAESIGHPSSHGCIRLGDDDIAWLYRHVPVGTPVIIR